ncbi:MAG: histidine kinase [Bacteroidales bacterium]|nr:histidine kinase [Bacteroidales bacterium]
MRRQLAPGFLKNWKTIEQTAYWVVWSILAFLPMIFWDISDPEEKIKLFAGWIRILPFFIIFLLHNLLLLPHLLLKNKYLSYGLATLALILLVNYWFVYSDYVHDQVRQLFENLKEQIPREYGSDGGGSGYSRGGHGGGYHGRHYPKHEYWRSPATLLIMYTYNVLISILLIGFNCAIKFTAQWLSREQERKEVEKVAAESQLMALQNQVSPHFFMNTLNNIHALIEYSKEEAQEAVLRLSKMMRYLLYESDHGKTPIAKEIEFLLSYIELMKLRLQPGVDLRVSFPDPVPDVKVHSLLILPFIENAFKHGIDPQNESFIHILIEVKGDRIHFNCRNSKSALKQKADVGGIGIENARKRMDLLYQHNYQLNIYNLESEFEVDFSVPIL